MPPTGAKGMNMALYDVAMLAQALVSAVRDEDQAALDAYSSTVLPRVWKYQEFSAWMIDTMHDGGVRRCTGHSASWWPVPNWAISTVRRQQPGFTATS